MEEPQALVQSDGISRGQLQRRFRSFENERKGRKELRMVVPRLHEQKIKKLQDDCYKRRSELFLTSNAMKQKCQSSHIVQIANLQDEADWYKRSVVDEKLLLNKLSKNAVTLETDLFEKKRESGGVDASNQHNAKLERKIRNHENLLDKALVKFNEASNSNQQLKDDIDYLRRERLVFDSVQEKMLREIRSRSRTTSAMIENSEKLGHDTHQYQDRMATMKVAVDTEMKSLEKQWHDIAIRLQQDRHDIALLENAQSQEMQGHSTTQTAITAHEKAMRERISRADERIEKNKKQSKLALQGLKQHKEAVAQIQRATDIDNIDTLVNDFVVAEEDNFHLYKQVDSLTKSKEEVEEVIALTAADLAKYQSRDNPNETKATRLLHSLKKRLDALENETKSNDMVTDEASETMTTLCKTIDGMITRLGINETAAAKVLSFTGLSESTIPDYLGMVEQFTTSLLSQFVRQNNATDERILMPTHEYKDVVVMPPSMLDSGSEGEDEDEGENESDPEPIDVSGVREAPNSKRD